LIEASSAKEPALHAVGADWTKNGQEEDHEKRKKASVVLPN